MENIKFKKNIAKTVCMLFFLNMIFVMFKKKTRREIYIKILTVINFGGIRII